MSIQTQINRIKANVNNALSSISNKGVTVPSGAASGDLAGLIDCIGIGFIPDYWKSYLATKATEINTALNAAGDNKSAFLWYTDSHFSQNYGQSPMILKYLSKNTAMAKTFFGGDIAVEKTGEIDKITAWHNMVRDIPNHHSVIGNHDNQVTELPTAAERADYFILPERTGDMSIGTDATNGKLYYYIDNHIENTRYICLSTGRMWTYKDEMEWCAEVLNSTPKNWHIVVIGHLWLNYDSNGIITTPENYVQSLLTMFDDYNYRGSGTTAVNSVAYNFADAQAKIEFVIGGHIHQDYDFTTATGIPVILTECDGWGERDSASVATKGTTTENCVYAIVADYGAKAVKVINVGRGDTRSVAIPDVVTYTNWAKKSTESDGTTIYNSGKGYKENYRLDSSGVEQTATGWDITGFIPCKAGDIIRFKNVEVLDISNNGGSTKRSAIYVYNSDFSKKNNSPAWSSSSLPSSAYSAVYGDNGDVIQLTAPSAFGTYAYVRFILGDINENSVITVNEVID